MNKELQKGIITSIILFLLLIFFNFTNLFIIGLIIVCCLICTELNKIFLKLAGPVFIKRNRNVSIVNKFNFKYITLQFAAVSYVFLIFGGSSYELHGIEGSPIFFLYILSICFSSDIGGYFVGRSIGGKKLTKISPKKTISGTIGSFLFSILPLLLFYNYEQQE